LQQQWRNIGIVKRRDDQKLWRQFRTVCDAIFARRENERQQNQQQMQSNAEIYAARVVDIKKLTDLDDDALDNSRKTFSELQDAIKAIGAIPKEQYQALNKQLQAAIEAYQQRLHQLKHRKDQQLIKELQQRAQLCQQREQAVQTTEDTSELQAQWQDTSDLPKAVFQAISERWSNAAQLTESAQWNDTQEQQLQDWCIRAEILAGVETPKAHQQARMNYQVQRLAEGLGQKSETLSWNKLLEVAGQWYREPVTDIAQAEAFKARFEQAIAAMEKQLIQ